MQKSDAHVLSRIYLTFWWLLRIRNNAYAMAEEAARLERMREAEEPD